MNNQVICTIRSNGDKEYRLNKLLHREDGPAIEYPDGTKYWYQHSKLHRIDGPAVENADGTKFWYQHNQLHRENGPAVEYADGSKEYYLHDQFFKTQQVWQQVQEQLTQGQIYYYHPATQDWIKILYVSGSNLLGVLGRKYYSDLEPIQRSYLSSSYYRQKLSLTTTMYFQHREQLVWVDSTSLLQLQTLPFPEPFEFKMFKSQLLLKN